MNRNLKVFLLVLLLAGTSCYGQLTAKDSLLVVLGTVINDSLKVEVLQELAQETYYTDPAEAIGYCLQIKDISEKASFDYGKAMAYGWLAYLYEQRGNIDEAINYNLKSMELLIKIDDKKNLAAVYNNLAAIYKDRGQIDLALDYHYRCMQLRFELIDHEGVSVSLNNIGFIYYGQGKIKEALLYYKKSLELAEYTNHYSGIAVSCSNIADVYADQGQIDFALEYHQKALNIYKKNQDQYGMAFTLNSMGRIFESQNLDDKAMEYFNESKKIREEIEDIQGLGFVLTNIGNLYFKKGENDLAIENYLAARTNLEQVEDPMGLANVTYKMSECYRRVGDFSSAEKYGKESMRYAALLKFPRNIKNASGSLYPLYEDMGDYKNAYANYKLFIEMRDSLVNEENKKAAIRQKIQYDFDKKSFQERVLHEKEIKVHEANIQKQQLALGLTGGILLLIIILGAAIYLGKRKSDHLLLNILPYETAKELKKQGWAKTRQYSQVTVLFTDFKGFTQIAEKLSAEELVQEINVCFSAFDRIIEKYNIEKIKTIGDAYMAAGGLPRPGGSHGIDTVRAALEIRKFIDDHAREREAQGKEAFQIRIGIHTGPVIAGIVGIKKFAYDIWGDTVNTASRMESSGMPGKVNISETTYQLVNEHFDCEYRGKVEAKNKGLVDMYFVEKKKESL